MPTDSLTPNATVDEAVETNAALENDALSSDSGFQDAASQEADGNAAVDADSGNLEMLMDVTLRVTVELGRTRLKIRDILNLASGSVVPLEKQASEPVDIMVNGALLASGEVVVVDDQFAVRITKLLNRVERLKKLI